MNDFDTKWIKWIFKWRQFSGSFRTKANWCAKAISNFYLKIKKTKHKKRHLKISDELKSAGTDNKFSGRIWIDFSNECIICWVLTDQLLEMDVDVYSTRWSCTFCACLCVCVYILSTHVPPTMYKLQNVIDFKNASLFQFAILMK